jgi:hypothetical protein
MIYRVGIVTNTMKFLGSTFKTREEVDDYLLRIDEAEGLKKYRIEENLILIETEEGKK